MQNSLGSGIFCREELLSLGARASRPHKTWQGRRDWLHRVGRFTRRLVPGQRLDKYAGGTPALPGGNPWLARCRSLSRALFCRSIAFATPISCPTPNFAKGSTRMDRLSFFSRGGRPVSAKTAFTAVGWGGGWSMGSRFNEHTCAAPPWRALKESIWSSQRSSATIGSSLNTDKATERFRP